MKDGHAYLCKECNRKRGYIFRHTPSGIYTNLKAREKFRGRKPVNISRDEFVSWYNNQDKQCVYCGISAQDVWIMRKFYNAHAEQLTIDCKVNNRGYVSGNLVLACGRCNFIKGNMFTYAEMREIGQRYIRPKWETLKTKPQKGGE